MKKTILILLIVTIMMPGLATGTDKRAAYDQYVESYNQYQAAVSEGRPLEEIMQLMERYRAARA